MSILIFFAVLVLLILVHEWGHFIVAKKSGIRVDEFGIGFPPKAWGKKIGETEYTLNWLPVGGFVRIWGEDPTQEHYEDGPDSERSFVKQPRYIQAAVLVAGVAMNVVFAYFLFVVAFMIGIPTAVDEGAANQHIEDIRLLVTSVLPDTPAASMLEPGDEILAVERGAIGMAQSDVPQPSEVSGFVSQEADTEVTFTVVRHKEEIEVTVTPTTGIIESDPTRTAAGFTMALIGTESLPLHLALVEGAKRTYYGLIDIATGLGGLALDAFRGEADMSNVAGPVGIVGLVGDAAALGFVWLLTFSAFISLNLAIINLLPIPALDGGRLVFVFIEAIMRRPIKPIVATRVNQFGFMALLALMAIVTVYDVARLVQ